MGEKSMFDTLVEVLLDCRARKESDWRYFSSDMKMFEGYNPEKISRMMSGLLEAGLIERIRCQKRHFQLTDAGVQLFDSIEQTQKPIKSWIFPRVHNEVVAYLIDRNFKFPLIGDNAVSFLKPLFADIQARYNLSTSEMNDLCNKSFHIVKSRAPSDTWRFTLHDEFLQKEKIEEKIEKESVPQIKIPYVEQPIIN